MWQEGVYLFLLQQGPNFTFGIIQVSKYANRIHAGRYAGRLFAFGNIIVTEAAFFDDPFLVGLANVVRAGRHAHFAADAFFWVDMHNAVGGLVGRICRADRLAWWIVTVHALHWKNLLLYLGIATLFAKFQTIIEAVRRQLPLHLAGNAAGAAACAF